MRQKLPIPVSPIAGESLHGLLLRAAEANLYGRASWIAGLIDENIDAPDGIIRIGSHAANMSVILAVRTGTLQLMGYCYVSRGRGHYEGFGRSFHFRQMIDLKHARFCPECLSESGHIRQAWDISLATACPVHKKTLIASCPECGRRLSYRRSRIRFCECGNDLASVISEDASPAAAALSSLFYEKAGLKKADQSTFGFPQELQALSLERLTLVISAMAGVLSTVRDKRDPRIICTLDPLVRARVVGEVAHLLQDWPLNFKMHLDVISRGPSGDLPTRTKINARFDNCYRRIYDPGNDGLLDFLRQALEGYLNETGYWSRTAGSGRPRSIFRNNAQPTSHVSKTEAMKILRLGEAHFKRLLKQGRLSYEVSDSGLNRYVREHLLQLKSELDNDSDPRVGSGRLADALGTDVGRAGTILKEGLLEAERGPTVDGHRNWVLRESTLLEFLAALESGASADRTGQGWMSYRSAMAHLRSRGVTLGKFMEALVRGNIQYRLRDDLGDAPFLKRLEVRNAY